MKKEVDQGSEIPTFLINADNIPQAHYRATKAVLGKGMQIRTEYDRKDDSERFLDPPSRDATVTIHISNPFNQPRYPCVSCCERGTYIAEIMGLKDHKVIPIKQLRKELAKGKKLETHFWPYLYHQRLFSHPAGDKVVDQMAYVIDKLAKDPITRRAIMTTRLPEIDTKIKEDLPCLGELHFRCTKKAGELYLNMNSYWRSRDLMKAWHDNVIGLTFMQQVVAKRLGQRMGREVKVGGYTDTSTSLHLYGQDIAHGSSAGMTAGQYVALREGPVLGRAKTSDFALENYVLPDLDGLLDSKKIQEWSFGEEQIRLLEWMTDGLKTGRFIA